MNLYGDKEIQMSGFKKMDLERLFNWICDRTK